MLGFSEAYWKMVGSVQCFSPTGYLSAVPGRCSLALRASVLLDSQRSTMESNESRCWCGVRERPCWHEFEVGA